MMVGSDKNEAVRAKELAEKQIAKKEFANAKKYAIKAYNLCPSLEGISQMLATLDVYMASQVKINGETDFYAVLGLNPTADDESVKKQYRKLALNLHPDKNKTVGAEGAFKFVSEAWSTLSDSGKRASYDERRNTTSTKSPRQNRSSGKQTQMAKSSTSNRPAKRSTFWTTCSSCKMQFEYLRIYLNQRLTCQSCWSTFVAVETGRLPTNVSTPFVPTHRNGHVPGEINYYMTNSFHFVGGGISGIPYGIVSEIPSMTVQWVPLQGSVADIHISPATAPPTVACRASEKVKRTREIPGSTGKDLLHKNGSANVASNHPEYRADQPAKKMKCERILQTNNISSSTMEISCNTDMNGGAKGEEKDVAADRIEAKFSNKIDQSSVVFTFDARKLLIEKTKREIRYKLEEMRLASMKAKLKTDSSQEVKNKAKSLSADINADNNLPRPQGLITTISINVPDPDFHNFDKDRLEVCFKPNQVWAVYDDDDGMPRLYTLIRKVVSVKPFRIQLSYLNAKSNSEFAPVNWMASGFNKTCGTFRLGRCEVIDTVNVFSHVVDVDWGLRGIVSILPKRGDIWALYRNWSPEWDDTTPSEVRHQYEMVEVLDDYTEELGVHVAPVIKSVGFKSVFRRGQSATRCIPRSEMFRFSHQVPSWPLRGDEADSLPTGCWDLDPAATPANVLDSIAEPGKDELVTEGSGDRHE